MKSEFTTEKGKKVTAIIDGSNKRNTRAVMDGDSVRVCLFSKEEMENITPDPEIFKNNIKNKAGQASPFPWLLWPSDYFEDTDGTFGYVTEQIPSGFIPLKNYINNMKRFKNWSVSCIAALELVWIFYSLHILGYRFFNMTNEDVFINGNTGKVILTGAEWLGDQKDAVWRKGKEISVLVHPLYFLGKKQPDRITDEYLLSVLLFEILCLQHPLEGHEVASCPVLRIDGLNRFYGTEPLFIFDRENDSNRPVKGVHLNVSKLWSYCPECIKANFYRAFSQSVMTGNEEGVSVSSWYHILDYVRSSVVLGTDGTEKILAETKKKKVSSKGEDQKETEEAVPLSWETGDGENIRRFFLVPGNKIYMSQLNLQISEPFEVAGEIAGGEIAKMCYILNKTQEQWSAQYEDKIFLVSPGETLPVTAGMSIQMGKRNKIRITETKVTG